MPVVAHNQLDPQPFRDWCDERVIPTEELGVDLGELAGLVYPKELAAQLGVYPRRLYAWRYENTHLDRDLIEDALHRAGYVIEDVYPSLPPLPAFKPGRGGAPPGKGSFLSDEEVLALHELHTKGASIRELARRIYAKAGYKSAEAAMHGIRGGFRRLGLEAVWRHPTTLPIRPRRCVDQAANGDQCKADAIAGSDRCYPHAHPEVARESIANASARRWAEVAA